MSEIIMGLITGILFGALLQMATVLRYDRQVGALRFLDMTIVKFMLSSIIVAMVGIHILAHLGIVAFKIKPTLLGANVIGGLVFGLGWGIFGYCPGTALGALGEGRWDAIWGILGMILGAGVFAEIYPLLKDNLLSWGDLGKATLPDLLGINQWFVIAGFIIVSLLLFKLFQKKKL